MSRWRHADEVGFIYLLAFCLSVALCMTLRTGMDWGVVSCCFGLDLAILD
jgi:hypothetical protein